MNDGIQSDKMRHPVQQAISSIDKKLHVLQAERRVLVKELERSQMNDMVHHIVARELSGSGPDLRKTAPADRPSDGMVSTERAD